MAHIATLPDNLKQLICQRRLEQVTFDNIVKELADNGVSISKSTVSIWVRSPDGAKVMSEVQQELEKEWKGEPLASKLSRVHAAIEKATRLRRFLRSLPQITKDWLSVSREFRSYLTLIREEMEPLRLEMSSSSVESPFEEWQSVLDALEDEIVVQ